MQREYENVYIQKIETNGFAITALILGIVAVVLNFVIIIPYFLGILAIIFGAFGLRKEVGRGLAIAGIFLGSLSLVMKILFWSFIFLIGSGNV